MFGKPSQLGVCVTLIRFIHIKLRDLAQSLWIGRSSFGERRSDDRVASWRGKATLLCPNPAAKSEESQAQPVFLKLWDTNKA
jgi:hypothetical protein